VVGEKTVETFPKRRRDKQRQQLCVAVWDAGAVALHQKRREEDTSAKLLRAAAAAASILFSFSNQSINLLFSGCFLPPDAPASSCETHYLITLRLRFSFFYVD